MNDNLLYGYGVYWAHPPYAHRFIVLRYASNEKGEIFWDRKFFIGSDSLDSIYDHMMRRGCALFMRSQDDDPNLIQQWI